MTHVDEDTRLGRNNPYNYMLRDDGDEVRDRRCEVCRLPMRHYKHVVAHEVEHVRDGKLIPLIVRHSMLVHLVTPEQAKGFVTAVVLPFESLDWSTNGCRVTCPECGDFLYLDFRDGKDYWRHYPRMVLKGRDWVTGGDSYDPEHEVGIPLPEVV